MRGYSHSGIAPSLAACPVWMRLAVTRGSRVYSRPDRPGRCQDFVAWWASKIASATSFMDLRVSMLSF